MGSTLAVANKSRVPISDWSSRLRALERFLIEKFLKVSSGRESQSGTCSSVKSKTRKTFPHDRLHRLTFRALLSQQQAEERDEEWEVEKKYKRALEPSNTADANLCLWNTNCCCYMQTIRIREKNDDLCDAVHLFHTSAPHVHKLAEVTLWLKTEEKS